ncbi:polysaccharide biosynthesis/export family protein (plasmid) [Salipiger sp. H15]|uniref:Polysaccharide biosynthesis/export family protein n=1 Tax=Alloyangia sp. H15 TaxID=3029062 RepID=A0AAU8AQ29_9RHOB
MPLTLPTPVAWALTTALLLPLPALAEGYSLQPGDRVDIRVAGLPNLDRDLRIGEDGTVSLPLVGRVPLRGMTIGEAEEDVARRFGQVAFRQRSLDGRETLFSISPSEVSLSVSEFRPVYVSGDVKSAGAFPFSPGLTVRRALTLSGGIGEDLGYQRDPMAQIAQVQGNIDALGAELSALDVRVRRYQAELDPGAGAAEAGDTAQMGTGTVEEVESQRLAAGVSGQKTKRAYLLEARGAVTNQITVLRQQLDAELEGEDADQQEYDRIRTLRERGLIEEDRVTETRRSLLASATRRLDTAADLADAEKDLARINFDLGDFEDEARRDALDELSDALVDRETTRARLTAARQQLLFLNADYASALDESVVGIVVRRGTGAEEETFQLGGEEDMALLPGDLIEVQLSAAPVPGQ